MLRALRSAEARLLPQGPIDLGRQLLLLAAAYYGYRIVRGAVDGKATTAFENARDLISIERSLHLFVEPSVQAWATSTGFVVDFASWMYINSHFVVTFGALAFIYLFRNEHFYFVRNMFMVAMGIALIGYVAFPTAPPRFFPEWGFTDSVSEFTGVDADSVAVNALFNPFAAVPSMHVAFALMIGVSLARLVKPWTLQTFWFAYPAVVTFVVIATGNHFWLDAALGAATAGVSALAADRLLARARPAVWSFRPERAEAPA